MDDGAFHVAVALGTDRECDQGLGEPSLRVERCGQLLIDGCEEAFVWGGSRLMAPAGIATLPMWMRHLGGFDQPAAVDAAIVPAARMAVRAMSLGNSRPMLAVARWARPAHRGGLRAAPRRRHARRSAHRHARRGPRDAGLQLVTSGDG